MKGRGAPFRSLTRFKADPRKEREGPEERASMTGVPFLHRWLALSLFLIVVTAVFSVGFQHPDEHFQTLEFLNYKLGGSPASALAWEFAARMRSWLQPGLYYLLARGFLAVGFQDRFGWAFAFRLFSGLLAWLAIGGLALCSRRWLTHEDRWRWTVRALCLTAFMPYLAVRASSESLATSCLVLAITALVVDGGLDGRLRALVAAGALLGLAVEFRYPVGIMVLGVVAWLLVIAGLSVRRLLWVAAGALPVLVLSAVVDHWGYGEWVFPPWHYIQENLLHDRAAQLFGSRPWYAYVTGPLATPLAPVVLVLMAATLVGWFRRPRHVLTWATLPYVLAHSFLAHKEVRFLFPVAFLAPVFLGLALAPEDRAPGWQRRWLRPESRLARLIIVWNLVGLVVLCLVPTRLELRFQKYVYRNFPAGFQGYRLTGSPYEHSGLPMYFYRPPSVDLRPASSPAEARAAARGHAYLVTGGFHDPDDPALADCVTRYRSFPLWVRRLNWFDWQSHTTTWALHECPATVPQTRSGSGRPQDRG
jgi:phosphatidylinositol glycan class B